MIPTIYKPSIYKGAGIYKAGAEGGGGGDNSVLIGDKWYRTCNINGKIWLAQNLDYKFPGCIFNPDNWGSYNLYGGNCKYYDGGIKEPYTGWGLLYSFIAVRYLENNKASLIPGWRVATTQDWNDLISFLGSTSALKIKSKTSNWNTNNGTDDFGFSAVPAGWCDYSSGSSNSGNTWACWWTNEGSINANASGRYFKMSNTDSNLGSNNYYNRQGMSLRLIKE